MIKPALQILSDANVVARAAAQLFADESLDAVTKRGFFSVALSGGSTPKRLYELMADSGDRFRAEVPWDRTHFFWTDERHVPPDHPDSNYRMAYEAMLSHVSVPKENVHRIPSENPSASVAADEYETTLREFFHHKQHRLPRFDLILLGLGTDGHTASLFPHSDLLHERQRLVAAAWVEQFNSYRITMTPVALDNAALLLFLVCGAEKAEILLRITEDPGEYPVRVIRPSNGRVLWLVDEPAGRLVKGSEVLRRYGSQS